MVPHSFAAAYFWGSFFQETYFCWKHLRSILMYPWHLDIAMVGMWRGWRKKSSIWLWRTVPLNDSTFFFFSTFRQKNGQKHPSPLTKVTHFAMFSFLRKSLPFRGLGVYYENYRCLFYGRNWFWYVTTSLGANKTSQKKNNWKPSTITSNNHKTSIIQRHWCPLISRDLQPSVRHIFNWCAICAMFCFLEKVWGWGSKVAWIWSLFGSSSDLDRIELWVTSKGIIYKVFVIIQNAPYP